MTNWARINEAVAGCGSTLVIEDANGDHSTFATSDDVKMGDQVKVTIEGIDVTGIVVEIDDGGSNA